MKKKIYIVGIYLMLITVTFTGCFYEKDGKENNNDVEDIIIHYEMTLESFTNLSVGSFIIVPVPIYYNWTYDPTPSQLVVSFTEKYQDCTIINTEYGIGLNVTITEKPTIKNIIIEFEKNQEPEFDNSLIIEFLSNKNLDDNYSYFFYSDVNKSIEINYFGECYRIVDGERKGINTGDDDYLLDAWVFQNVELKYGWQSIASTTE